MKIRKIMTRNAHAVVPGTSVSQVAEEMFRHDIGSVPVIEDDDVVGIITDRDIVVRIIAKGLPVSTPVSEAMSRPVLCCGPEEDLDSVMEMMREEQIRRMPVCAEGGRLLGMLSVGDAVRYERDSDEVARVMSGISRPAGRHCQTHADA